MREGNAERIYILWLPRSAPDDILGDSPDHTCRETQRIQGHIPVDRILAVRRGPLLAHPRSHNTGCAADHIERAIAPLLNNNDLCHTKIQVMEAGIAKDHR